MSVSALWFLDRNNVISVLSFMEPIPWTRGGVRPGQISEEGMLPTWANMGFSQCTF